MYKTIPARRPSKGYFLPHKPKEIFYGTAIIVVFSTMLGGITLLGLPIVGNLLIGLFAIIFFLKDKAGSLPVYAGFVMFGIAAVLSQIEGNEYVESFTAYGFLMLCIAATGASLDQWQTDRMQHMRARFRQWHAQNRHKRTRQALQQQTNPPKPLPHAAQPPASPPMNNRRKIVGG